MWTLSGFSDEISPDPREQCQVASGLGLKYVEIRSAWNVNILDLDADQLATLQQTLKEFDLSVSSIGSPIGKIAIDDDFEPHLERMRHAAEVARAVRRAVHPDLLLLHPRGRRPGRASRRGAAPDAGAWPRSPSSTTWSCCTRTRRRSTATSRAAAWTSSPPSTRRICGWPGTPANFVQVGVRPFTEGYAALRPYVDYIQIKDARLADASVVVAGAGDGEVVETIRALRADGFDGFFSLEPHLADYNATGGFSGAELWTSAWQAFTDILTSEGIEYA